MNMGTSQKQISDNEKNNLHLELEQLSLWNRHGETTLWTVGSVLLSFSYYAISKIFDKTINDPIIIIIMSISFIIILWVFIWNYLPTVIKDTFRLTNRMKILDKKLGIELHYSLTADDSDISEIEIKERKISNWETYKTPFGLLFAFMTVFNLLGWLLLLYKNIKIIIC